MRALSRLLPHPLLSLAVALVWLLLANSVAPAHLLLAALLGIAIPRLTAGLFPERLQSIHLGMALKLFLHFLWDIVMANVAMARIILAPELRVKPSFLALPLSLTNPYAIAVLAGMITMTPGTVSVDLSPDGRTLWIHALNVEDPEGAVAEIKRRYEEPLKELFE
ncbi:Na+/H+ antiporter subunit E [Pelomicrobium sp. G1]|uniref:Na+/H+ antiporter subunit E n=1 Tax=unclassified Pelomicrobium TaxID=2815318 RepID=UPI003F76567D